MKFLLQKFLICVQSQSPMSTRPAIWQPLRFYINWPTCFSSFLHIASSSQLPLHAFKNEEHDLLDTFSRVNVLCYGSRYVYLLLTLSTYPMLTMPFLTFLDAGATDENACAAVPLEDYNMGLRVGTIFIILGTSSIGKLLFPVLLTVNDLCLINSACFQVFLRHSSSITLASRTALSSNILCSLESSVSKTNDAEFWEFSVLTHFFFFLSLQLELVLSLLLHLSICFPMHSTTLQTLVFPQDGSHTVLLVAFFA